MNRAEQKKQEKEHQEQIRQMWPSGFCGIPKDIQHLIKDGDKFTIKGLRRFEDGTIDSNCEDGKETIWVAKHEK